jgi:uncharacterized protein (TIGR02598 family)
MKPPTMHSSRHGNTGFSLVELTLALGIAGTALVTAVGLLGTSLHSQGLSADDTTLATISEQVLGELRSADFDTLWEEVPGAATELTKPAAPDAEPQPSTYYFTQEGGRVEPGDPQAHYECVVVKVPDRTRQSPDPATQVPGQGRHNLLMVELKFSYPVSLPAKRRPNHRSLHANVARY